MTHVISTIERRLGHRPGEGRVATRLALASALLLALGAGALLAGQARAQAPDPSAAATIPATDPATGGAITDAAPAVDAVREAGAVLDALAAGDGAGVHARFNETMAKVVSAEQLALAWGQIQGQFGPLQRRGEAKVETRDGATVVKIPLHHQKGDLDAIVAFAADGRISGFALRPAQAAAAPPPAADAAFVESQLRIGDAVDGLDATLTLPRGKAGNGRAASGKALLPAVVLVHGSGPHDRDETIGPNRPFLDIAHGLAERGIAVLRYEKRTRAHPQAFVGGGSIDLETTDDAVAAVAVLRAQPGIDPTRVFVLGHSQGGMLAPRIAARDPAIAGLVLLAAPSRPLLDILIEQNRRLAFLNDGKTSPEESAAIAALVDSVKQVRSGADIPAEQSPMGIAPAYWRTVEAVDPLAEARAIAQPLLILQGARDIQVVDADWQGWRGAFHDSPRATFTLYDTLNHLGIPGEGDGTIAEYMTPGHVAPALIADIAAWIGRTGAPGRPAAARGK